MSIVTVQLTIHSGNAAFDDDPAAEAGRILHLAATAIEESINECSRDLYDINGNNVGWFYFAAEKDDE